MEVKLIVIGGKNHGRKIPIVGPQFLIGRTEGCQLRPASDRISRKHCVLLVEEGRVLLRDLGSTNHTFVNREQVTGDRELKNGDRLNVGGVLEFEVQLTVHVGGKKKTKVHSVQEAAARSMQSTTSEEIDISDWLEEEEGAASPKPATEQDLKSTRADQSLSDTTTVFFPPVPEEKKEDDKKKPGKNVGQFDKKKKHSAETSGEAANDMLRQFFGRKRP